MPDTVAVENNPLYQKLQEWEDMVRRGMVTHFRHSRHIGERMGIMKHMLVQRMDKILPSINKPSSALPWGGDRR